MKMEMKSEMKRRRCLKMYSAKSGVISFPWRAGVGRGSKSCSEWVKTLVGFGIFEIQCNL